MLVINEVEMDISVFIMSLIFELYTILTFELKWIIYKMRRKLRSEVSKLKARKHTQGWWKFEKLEKI